MIISGVGFTPVKQKILSNGSPLSCETSCCDTVRFSCKSPKPLEKGSRKYWKLQTFRAKEALLGGNIPLFNSIKKDFDINNKILNLKGFDLSRRTILGANLSRVNLEKANLNWTSLQKSALEGANLYKANLLHTIVFEISFDDKTNFRKTLFDPNQPVNGLSVEQLKKEGFYIVNKGSETFKDLIKDLDPMQLQSVADEWNFIVAYRPKDSKAFYIEESLSGNKTYDVGIYHTSPLFSRDNKSPLHPGLYIYPNKELVERIHKGKDIIQVLIPLGNSKASNVLKADYRFRTPTFITTNEV